MARQFAWALVAAVALGSAATLAHGTVQTAEPPAQTAEPPAQQAGRSDQSRDGRREHGRGPWWKAPHPAAAELALSADQSATIDRIFWAYVEKSKPLRAELNDLERGLDRVMRANTADVSVVEQEAARIESRRAELNQMRTVMLYRIRRVLNPEQNAKFQKYMDRVEADRKKQDAARRR